MKKDPVTMVLAANDGGTFLRSIVPGAWEAWSLRKATEFAELDARHTDIECAAATDSATELAQAPAV